MAAAAPLVSATPHTWTVRDPAQHFLPHLLGHLRVKQGPTFSPDRAGLAFLHSSPHSASFLHLPSKLNHCLCRQQLACCCVSAVDKFRHLFAVSVSLLLSVSLSWLSLPPTLSQELLLLQASQHTLHTGGLRPRQRPSRRGRLFATHLLSPRGYTPGLPCCSLPLPPPPQADQMDCEQGQRPLVQKSLGSRGGQRSLRSLAKEALGREAGGPTAHDDLPGCVCTRCADPGGGQTGAEFLGLVLVVCTCVIL